ncbi:MAG TPA: proteasome accessory factor PafA2 family protein [Candidatus Saccharimonadales bacterium]|nr:proteasome accessory factor PafA2 family protein [Candidatus Saccharimonadales bacterium]
MSEVSAQNGAQYPFAYGIEEEISLRHLPGSDFSDQDLRDALNLYQLSNKDVFYTSRMDSTGGGLYIDRSHLELTTPEYATVNELTARAQSHEQKEIAIVTAFLKGQQQSERRNRVVGIHRRIVDTRGNTYGLHDNYGFLKTPQLLNIVAPIVSGHLATRSFVTGAGYVTPRSLLFAQKAQHVDAVMGYEYNDTMFRTTSDEGGTRFETRCNDINISPWAIRIRIGSTAIALVLGRTPAGDNLARLARELLGTEQQWHKGPYRYNQMHLKQDGSLRARRNLFRAIRYQMQMAETFLSSDMAKYGPEPPVELALIAHGLYDYCKDVIHVVTGDAPYTSLADRADWAAKVMLIDRRIERDKQDDPKMRRTRQDATAIKDDLAYDYIQVDNREPPVRVRYGTGYLLRDKKHFFAGEIDPAVVAQAGKTPPSNMRGALRAELLKNYDVSTASWRSAALINDTTGNTITVSIDDPRTHTFSPDQLDCLARARRRTHSL